jgi:hypothetical protein
MNDYIIDFLPKYPNIHEMETDIFNPYRNDFYDVIYRKKEFYDEKLSKIENVPSSPGDLMKHQKIISRFFSSRTMYDQLLLFHEMGCVAGDTLILMWDGTMKHADKVEVGDKIIGDDGKFRTVLELVRGTDKMYLIKQKRGMNYVVNSNHILTLKNNVTNDILDIRVSDYLKLTNNEKRNLKGYKNSACINWEYKEVPIDPYLFGKWLIVHHLDNKIDISMYPKIFLSFIDEYELYKNKYIPNIYLTNDKKIRKELLRGLMDTDIKISEHFSDFIVDIVYLIKSLGLEYEIIDGIIKITESEYLSDIEVSTTGIDKYYGWKLDGNRRFLLGDFTVTHNSGKTCAAISAIEQIRSENSSFTGAILCTTLTLNFINELVFK